MKSVLISIQPKWCELIASGKKTIEVRKTRPQIETPVKCYIYETKSRFVEYTYGFRTHYGYGKGKVIGEFVCDRISRYGDYDGNTDSPYFITPEDLKQTCLTFGELVKYGRNDIVYGWHISDLVIYDKPRELGEFKIECKQYGAENPMCDDCKYFINCTGYEFDESDCACDGYKPLERPFQSWGYVEAN